jgi:glucose/arabinose dehydrogenase
MSSPDPRAAWRRYVALPVLLLALATAAPAAAGTVPDGFTDTPVLSGLDAPTAVRFSPDGRVFVAEQSGIVKIFASPTATTGTTFADLRPEVDGFWDRGLLGLALDPGFPARPYVYVLYSYDAPLGSTAPVWNDACADPSGNGCVGSARLSRLTATGDTGGQEKTLAWDWCQQAESHSIADLGFGPDGALYASAGDGASARPEPDTGGHVGDLSPTLTGRPRVCGDPVDQGGALRAQDLLTPSDPVGFDGSIVRLAPDPATGELGKPHIVAEGLRNPFRFTFRPGTGELWLGDVGWNSTEEIDRFAAATTFANFGWPCYEGAAKQPGYGPFGLCQQLYGKPDGTVTAPYFTYQHKMPATPGDTCASTRLSSITGIAFARSGSPYPAPYDSALFFADHSRNCIWAMTAGAGGLPDPASVRTFDAGAAHPVDLQIGPGGDLFYVDLEGGAVHRVSWKADEPAGGGPPPGGTTPPPPDAGGPVPTIATPTAGTSWRAGRRIAFEGSASDPLDGPLPASALRWTLRLHPCAPRPGSCPGRIIGAWGGTRGAGFRTPDPRRLGFLELSLEAVDSRGRRATTSVRLDPSVVRLTLASEPGAMRLRLDGVQAPAPISVRVVRGSTHQVTAARRRIGRRSYRFLRWSDGKPASHAIAAGRSRTLTATFERRRR